MKTFRVYSIFMLFIAGVLSPSASNSQAPGGVQNPMEWKVDWDDNSQEEHGHERFNFHPYQFFTEDRGYAEVPLENFKKISLFMVYSSKSKTTIGSVNTGERKVLLSKNKLISRREFELKEMSKPQFITFIESMPTGTIHKNESPSVLIGSKHAEDEWFEGGVAELIVYDRLLSKKQRRKVESYLSMKYGLSLPTSADYYLSNGSIIRHADTNGPFNSFVTAIGRDDGSGLYQKQSMNLHSDVDLRIGLGNVSLKNIDNASSLNNESFLFWADDNKAAQFENINSKLPRSWELNFYGEDVHQKTWHIQVDANTLGNMNADLPFYLIIGDDERMDDNEALRQVEMKKNNEGFFECYVKLDNNNSGRDYLSFTQQKLDQLQNETDTDDLFPSYATDGVFPNPVRKGELFYLGIQDVLDKEVLVEIFNVNSQLVSSKNVKSTGSIEYSNALIVAGQYTVKVSGDKTRKSYKLIVQ